MTQAELLRRHDASHRSFYRALAAQGLHRDSWPMVMAAPLDDLELEPRRQIELHPEPTYTLVAELNDVAYGIPPEQSFATALAQLDDPDMIALVAEADGRPS